ncbi:hypothetical protein [Candidatus Nitrososphaera sp. FF02]|uniref:hypothetical protein n=1 Tax=Candidatus Nitrososphaera sp. FF02 TaxID=3398226 RepID=UPI0039EA2670
MNYFQRGTLISIPAQRMAAGYVVLSVGVLMAISGGTWDVTNHLLNKPETFFSPPHAILYAGAGTAVAGAVLVLSAARAEKKFDLPARIAIIGVALLVSAGPVDFGWHSVFGLDGLLSPPHAVLVSGMVASAVGALTGIVYAWPRLEQKALPRALIVLVMLPVWLTAAGALHMFSLPFSDTAYFNFNPYPQAAVAVSTLGFPLVTAAVLLAASRLSGRKFGTMSILAGAFVTVGILTSILPNDALHATVPFYLSAVIPLVAADAVLSRWKSQKAVLFAGALIGAAFFMLYFPLITHTYNEVLSPERAVWASLTAIIYFEMLQGVFPLVAAPAAAMGVLGAMMGQKMVERAEVSLLK